jgi:hypothetical protein
LDCSAQERGQVAESIALDLEKRRVDDASWDAFYRSLARLLCNDAYALAGRRLLLTARRDLHPTEEVDDKGQQGRSRRRNVSAVFLPPLRGGDEKAKAATELPREVQRRLAYVAPGLEIAQDGTSAARRFLVAAGLVRERESREILRLLRRQ